MAFFSFHEVGLLVSSGWFRIYTDKVSNRVHFATLSCPNEPQDWGILFLTIHTSVFHTDLSNTISCQCTVMSGKYPSDTNSSCWSTFPLLEWARRGSSSCLRRSLTTVSPKWMGLEFPTNKGALASHYACSSHFYYPRAPCSEPQSTIPTWPS